METEHCKFHPEVEATRTCEECGAPICPECRVRVSGRSFCPEDAERLHGIHFGTVLHGEGAKSYEDRTAALEDLTFDLPPLIPGRQEKLGLHEILLVDGLLLWVIALGIIALLAGGGGPVVRGPFSYQEVLEGLDGVVLIASTLHIAAALGLRSHPRSHAYLGLVTSLLMLGGSLDLVLSLSPTVAAVAFPGVALPILSISAIMMRWRAVLRLDPPAVRK
ncbi:MAG: hypothetical protein KGI98_12395 [Euryarchaeota archaeon]|nr:hypothetical protein [Euryarchaeota archaeon]